jgi:hypothetical protein
MMKQNQPKIQHHSLSLFLTPSHHQHRPLENVIIVVDITDDLELTTLPLTRLYFEKKKN